MLLFDTTTRRLRCFLGGAGAIPFIATWAVLDAVTQALLSEAANPSVTNGATVVDVVGVPTTGTLRKVQLLQWRNSTGGAVTLTVRYDDNGTSRDFLSVALDAGDQLQYTDGEGWRVLDSTGKTKVTGGSGSSGITVEEVDGAPTLTATKIKFAQADGLTVTDEGGGVARINVSAAAAPDLSAQTIALLALMGF